MNYHVVAAWLGVVGTVLQLVGSAMTLWNLLSAPKTGLQRVRALIGALRRSRKSKVAVALSDLNEKEEDRSRVLQGLALFVLGYILALASEIWMIRLGP